MLQLYTFTVEAIEGISREELLDLRRRCKMLQIAQDIGQNTTHTSGQSYTNMTKMMQVVVLDFSGSVEMGLPVVSLISSEAAEASMQRFLRDVKSLRDGSRVPVFVYLPTGYAMLKSRTICT